MQVVFYTFSKRVNSTARPSGGASYSVILKSPSSVIEPQISLVWTGSGSPTAYNYAYIADFGRYYWVRNWAYGDRQWMAQLQVDTLASWKPQIGAATKYILRAADQTARESSRDVIDSFYPAKASKVYRRLVGNFDGGWGSSGNYVMGVIGAGNTVNAGGIGLYQATAAQAHTIISRAYNAMSVKAADRPVSGAFDGEWIKWLGDCLIRCTGKISDFITSMMYFPFSFDVGNDTDVYMGLIETGNGQAKPITSLLKQFNCTISLLDLLEPPESTYNVKPFKEVWLSVPPFGSIELDTADLYGITTLNLLCVVDALSGAGILYVKIPNPTVEGQYITIAQRTAQVGVQIPIAGNQTQPLSVATGAMTAIGSALTENYIGAAAGIGSMINASNNAVRNSGGSGGLAALVGDIELFYRRFIPVQTSISEFGAAICNNYRLDTLSGYIQTRDGDIEAPATAAELQQIESYLTGGFFYE